MKKSISISNEFHEPAVTNSVSKMKMLSVIHLLKATFILILLVSFSVNSYAYKNEEAVLKAYELRVNGKVDEAKALLEEILQEDGDNALANYELARTLNYMNLMGSEEATNALLKAKTMEPENAIYAYAYAKNCFLQAYIAMETGGGDMKEALGKTCKEFDNVLKISSDYPEALMYLVEIYGILPAEMGGDKVKAEAYTQQLEKANKFYGAKARLVMMPEGTDMVEYWKKYIAANGESCAVLKELGVAALFTDDIETGKMYFEKAMAIDPAQNIRLLDLSRYHQMKVMQNRELAKEELPKASEYIDQYLASTPKPIAPLKAYAIGTKARIAMFSGNNEEAQKLTEEAKALDPYFSRAFGIPSLGIFEPPTTEDHFFQSFFSPF